MRPAPARRLCSARRRTFSSPVPATPDACLCAPQPHLPSAATPSPSTSRQDSRRSPVCPPPRTARLLSENPSRAWKSAKAARCCRVSSEARRPRAPRARDRPGPLLTGRPFWTLVVVISWNEAMRRKREGSAEHGRTRSLARLARSGALPHEPGPFLLRPTRGPNFLATSRCGHAFKGSGPGAPCCGAFAAGPAPAKSS